MISHAGLRKGDVSSWQGKKDIFIFTFFSPPLLKCITSEGRAWTSRGEQQGCQQPSAWQGRAVASQGTRAGQPWQLQNQCSLPSSFSTCIFWGEYNLSPHATLNSFPVYLSV